MPFCRRLLPVAFFGFFALSGPAQAVAPAEPIPAEWLTPAERDHFEATPTLDEAIAFLHRLESRLPALAVTTFGRSGAGQPLPLVILSRERAFTPEAARKTGKPILLLVSGIHAGEVDGKDATLMILRDLALGRRSELLDAATILWVPVLNADGHERISPYNRPNQDGPKKGMGFRTTATGFNLNRDHLKAETPEMRAFLALVNAWRPHLHLDNHVTDGCDFDWTLTYATMEAPQADPETDAWLKKHLPVMLAVVERGGRRTGPYVDLRENNDPAQGFVTWVGLPRMSNGYFALRHRPTVLVELHSYKPFKERVLADRDFMLGLIEEVGRDPVGLIQAVEAAERRTVELGRPDAKPSEYTILWSDPAEADTIRFPVYDWTIEDSVVTGKPLVRYQRGKVREIEVPWYHKPVPVKKIPRPRGYLILPGWFQIEQRLMDHGLTVLELTEETQLDVEVLKAENGKYSSATYQGHQTVEARFARQVERRALPKGTLFVPADQPDFEVAMALLEPDSSDSLFSWGLLSTALEQKEYIDPRVLEGLVQKMLEDPQRAAEWRQALTDPALANDEEARYRWWYMRTPHWDRTQGELPYFRLLARPPLPVAPWKR